MTGLNQHHPAPPPEIHNKLAAFCQIQLDFTHKKTVYFVIIYSSMSKITHQASGRMWTSQTVSVSSYPISFNCVIIKSQQRWLHLCNHSLSAHLFLNVVGDNRCLRNAKKIAGFYDIIKVWSLADRQSVLTGNAVVIIYNGPVHSPAWEATHTHAVMMIMFYRVDLLTPSYTCEFSRHVLLLCEARCVAESMRNDSCEHTAW